MFIWLITNMAVMAVLSIVFAVLGLSNDDMAGILIYALAFGMGGSLLSLLMSKSIAQRLTGATIIETPKNDTERWLIDTTRLLSERAGIKTPEVAIYEGSPNAFATGFARNYALMAVSTGLLELMSKDEIEAVIGHELSHIKNGDMVKLALIQGVLNSFVLVVSRLLMQTMNEQKDWRPILITAVINIFLQIVLGVLATLVVASVSRKREFAADLGSAEIYNRHSMISALTKLSSVADSKPLPAEMVAFGINSEQVTGLFATHPPISERIKRLQAEQFG